MSRLSIQVEKLQRSVIVKDLEMQNLKTKLLENDSLINKLQSKISASVVSLIQFF